MVEIKIDSFWDAPRVGDSSCKANFDAQLCEEGSTQEDWFNENRVGFSAESLSFLLNAQNQTIQSLCSATGAGTSRLSLFSDSRDFRPIAKGLNNPDEVEAWIAYAQMIAPRSDDSMNLVAGLLDALAEQNNISLGGYLLSRLNPEVGALILQGMEHPAAAARLLNNWLFWTVSSRKEIIAATEQNSGFALYSGVRDYKWYFDEVQACSKKYYRKFPGGSKTRKTNYREKILSWLDAYARSKKSVDAQRFLTQFSPLSSSYQIDFSKERGDILGVRCNFDGLLDSKQSIPNDPSLVYEMIQDGTTVEEPAKELFEAYRQKLAVRLAAEGQDLPAIEDWGDHEPFLDILAGAGMDILNDKSLYNRLADQWEEKQNGGADPDNERDAGLVRMNFQDMEAEIFLANDAVHTTLWKTIDGIKYGIWELHMDDGTKLLTQIDATVGEQYEGQKSVTWLLYSEDGPKTESALIFRSEGEEDRAVIVPKDSPQENMQTFFRNLFGQAFGR